jgi:NADPH-dependent ferric siderophore reductase
MSEPRRRRSAYAATVLSTERLSNSLVRVVVGGAGLDGFEPSPFADSYVKVVFVDPSVPRPLPRTPDGRVAVDDLAGAPEQRPRMRSYTVRSFDAATRELTLDFVVHGDEGVAGPWAAAAEAGDELVFLGPGGSFAPDPSAGFHLFAGDLSALPAIAVALERLPTSATGCAVVEIHDSIDEIPLARPAGVTVQWVHQAVTAGMSDDGTSDGAGGREARPGARLVEAVRELPWPGGDVQAFVHGEAGAVKELRRYLRVERGVGLDRLSISGYWRLGVDDEGWRASKKQWTAEVEQAEAATA